MQLIPEWKKCLRMLSVQAMVLATSVQGAWAVLPREMLDSIPSRWVKAITILLLVLGIIGRLVVQPKLRGKDDA